ncbi:MAG: pyruvate kinase, partial [Schleiferiaceae bacterium]|nr:pyruvate kinase [Schleiferiaceae bacterium]MDP4749418.1 pyruvate kinase [Schleiferiaceae bacterium]
MKRTKIVATLGPASSSDEKLLELLWAGVNVFRVNFSHGDPEEHRLLIRRIRQVLEKNNMTAAILADLQGPKLRVGVVEEGAVVAPGDRVVFTNHKCEGTKERVYMTYQDFPKDVKPGERILLDDGKLAMDVVSTNGVDEVVAVVVQGGPLKSKKGVNLPNTHVSLPCLTEKDLVDLHVALDENVEWIGLSFVRNAEDIHELRKIIDDRKSNAGIVAKMEKPEAVADCDRILAATDAIMVARGDLGVEVPMESVPLIQKMLTQKAIALSKPVIVATQMMETMIESMTPTRAEVNDVANSVLDGADAVMLSGETSVGKYPVEVVQAMAKIIRNVEASRLLKVSENPPSRDSDRFLTDT